MLFFSHTKMINFVSKIFFREKKRSEKILSKAFFIINYIFSIINYI